MDITVVICSHNPRAEYLGRALDALKQQSLPLEQWELLLVDNRSATRLSSAFDLSWHPNARHVFEENLGQSYARLRGMSESVGRLVVFVDDDNVLDSDYLAVALQIHQEFPQLAAFGGSISPDYEVDPPDWFHPYRQMVAIREVSRDRWSNNADDFSSTPIGAGMVITRELASYYVSVACLNPYKKQLGRIGNELSGGDDVDIAMSACDMGKGKGVFAALKLIHIIPGSRLDLEYLLRLQRGMAKSITVRRHFRNVREPRDPSRNGRVGLVLKRLAGELRLIRMSPLERAFKKAWNRGVKEGGAIISQM